MNLRLRVIAVMVFAVYGVSSAQAGTFWFPIDGHYPYSTNLVVTAVPDLDQTTDTIRTRLWETGEKDVDSITSGGLWAFVKDGGGDWDFDGVRYDDNQGGTGHEYVWYDNHTGYDFISTDSGTHEIHAVEDGETCGYSSTYGQICIEHSLSGGTYRTWYTHMSNIPSALKTNGGVGHSIYRWQYLGDMSNTGASSVHLHFVTRKLVGSDWVVVDPYGHKPDWPGNTNDDSNNPYLWD